MRKVWKGIGSLARRLAASIRAGREEQEMREEMRFHMDMAATKHRAAGMSESDAMRAASVSFGGLERWTDEARDEARSRPLEETIGDIRYALRGLRRVPTFAVAVVLSLAIGIGAVSSLWTVTERVVLRPLSYGDRGELVMLWTNYREKRAVHDVDSYPDYQSWTTGNPDVAHAAVFNIWAPILTEGTSAEPLIGSRVSADFFTVLGVPPLLGRGFRTEEDVPGGPQVAVIAQSLWARRFHSDSAIIGKTIGVNGVKYTVVGVMPSSFRDPEPLWKHGAEIWRPLGMTEGSQQRNWRYLRVIARLKAGVTADRAQHDLDVISSRLAHDYPETNGNRGASVVRMHDQVVGESKPVLFAALAGALCLLLIVWGNVASLVLARHSVRAPELALRTAIGASRARLTRLLLIEVFVLASAGCMLALTTAAAVSAVLRRIAPADLPRVEEIHVDGIVIAATAFLSVVSALAFGLGPALRASRVDLTALLQLGNRSSLRGRLRSAIVVGELALSVVLLASAGLLGKSVLRMNAVPLGLEPDSVLTLRVTPLPGRYKTDTARRAFLATLDQRLRETPGITSFAMAYYVPLTGLNDTEVLISGPAERPVMKGVGVHLRVVTPDYFSILKIPIAGREFTRQDVADGPRVVVINQAAADEFYPGQSSIGRQLFLGTEKDTTRATIVGVAGNVRFEGPANPVLPEVFEPATQGWWATDALIVRGRDTYAGTLATIRTVIRSIDPMVAIGDVSPMSENALRFSERQRFYAWVFGLFAGAALLLSAIGVYGVIAYSVTLRRREIAIRMAIGAGEGEVARSFVINATWLVGCGIAIGGSGAILLGRALASLLFGVEPRDVPTLLAASIVLAIVGVIASAVPAIRAARTPPALSLRSDG